MGEKWQKCLKTGKNMFSNIHFAIVHIKKKQYLCTRNQNNNTIFFVP